MWSRCGSNKPMVKAVETTGRLSGINKIGTADYSPEKAGVGGSIPSLATMESTTY
jgi:hypothetical protein